MYRLVQAILVASLATACAPTPPGDRDGDGGASGPDASSLPRTDAGPRPDAGLCTDVVDVVFVLDTSSSMGFVLSQLEDQIAGVVQATNTLAADAHFGLVVFQDNFFIDNTGSSGTVHTTAATLQSAFANYRTVYTNNNRNPGDGPGGPTTQNPICEENALDALYAAATDFPWRDNATRVIIVATDDTFLEAPDNYGDRDGDGLTDKTDYPREGDYPALRTVADTIATLQNRRVRVFSFTRLTPPGIFERCGTPRRLAWSDITDGWTTPYGASPPIPAETDARNFDLEQIQGGQMSLSDTINEVVLDSYCVPPVL